MAVITISRQLGSRGASLARDLAKELGYEFVDKSVINKVIRQYGLHQLNDIYDHKPKVWELFQRQQRADDPDDEPDHRGVRRARTGDPWPRRFPRCSKAWATC